MLEATQLDQSPQFERFKDLLLENEQEVLECLSEKVSVIDERTGNDENLSASVSRVLVDAFKNAEIEQHTQLARVLSPLIVSSIHHEIRNSRETMIEAIYPVTGQLVSAGIASAMKELVEDINRKLENQLSPRSLMLRAKSAVTGKPYSELVLASTRDFRLTELLLIKRGSGVLISSWKAEEASNEDDNHSTSLSALLSAITEFSRDVLSSDGGELRALDFGERQVYIRASSASILAAIGTGSATAAVEKKINDGFLNFIDGFEKNKRKGDREGDANDVAKRLPSLAAAIQSETTISEQAKSGANPLVVILATLTLLLGGSVGWFQYQDVMTERLYEGVRTTIAGQANLKGFPIDVHVNGSRSQLTVTGLVPSPVARDAVVEKISAKFADIKVVDNLRVVALFSELDGAIGKLNGSLREIDSLSRQLGTKASQEAHNAVSNTVVQLSGELQDRTTDLGVIATTLGTTRANASDMAAELQQTRNAVTRVRTDLETFATASRVDDLVRQVASLSEQLSTFQTCPSSGFSGHLIV